MTRRLPPLKSLPAFEASARHLSFTLAAQELNVTQSAISQQVKTLEENLGVALFRRLNRGLALTEEGQHYFPVVRDSLSQLADGTNHLSPDHAGELDVLEPEPQTADMPSPLPEKPSIAVLPFYNLSGDAKQDYLGDGISENITTALSRVADMFVIARTSTLTYKGTPVKVQQVAEELGVRYVLEGSVQRSGDKVRVTAQLIDALTGHHLWTERYDREVEDAFTLQDDITQNVVTALEVQLTEGEHVRILPGDTNNPEAYHLVRRGISLYRRGTKEETAEARRLFQQAVELDPKYALGWNFIGFTHWQSAIYGWGENPAQEQAQAEELAHKASAIDPSSPGPYVLFALVCLLRRHYDEAIAYNEKAVALEPNSAMAVGNLGRTLVNAGRPEEALPLIQRAIRLSPYAHPMILRWEGLAYHSMGQYEEAIAAFKRARTRDSQEPMTVAWLALTYADMDRMEQARAAAQEVLKMNPGYSAKRFVKATLDH
jgi:adenylate cyclase